MLHPEDLWSCKPAVRLTASDSGKLFSSTYCSFKLGTLLGRTCVLPIGAHIPREALFQLRAQRAAFSEVGESCGCLGIPKNGSMLLASTGYATNSGKIKGFFGFKALKKKIKSIEPHNHGSLDFLSFRIGIDALDGFVLGEINLELDIGDFNLIEVRVDNNALELLCRKVQAKIKRHYE